MTYFNEVLILANVIGLELVCIQQNTANTHQTMTNHGCPCADLYQQPASPCVRVVCGAGDVAVVATHMRMPYSRQRTTTGSCEAGPILIAAAAATAPSAAGTAVTHPTLQAAD